MLSHDASYKLLFSHQAMMADLLRGFLPAEWAKAMQIDTLEPLRTNFVSDKLTQRHADLIWRLRQAFSEWLSQVLLPLRLPGVNLPALTNLEDIDTMLAERVVEWTEQWKQQGLEQGLEQGRAEERHQALERERQLLLRQAQHRFGESCAQALAALIAASDQFDALEQVGVWLIESADSDAFLTQVRTLLKSDA